ncbi:uncharacterized protein LOC118764605 isoform X1 [Octopus sinensis]|uniref:Uncharacterized protein LOC118764605 isoform X1 n=1 Tax=Octopus sinensis TaxID=2607531 RepID=A0A7E6F157_9MOLL|nr:uncharacterized protein LOC118764605 isoform X1 [Octopus sinensis]
MDTSNSGPKSSKSQSVHIRTNDNSPKIINESPFKAYLWKLRRLAIVCSIPSKMSLEIWKKSEVKTRILFLCLPLIYLIPAFDTLRFIWFIVASYTSKNTEYILGKCFMLMMKMCPGILTVIVTWKRSHVNALIDDIQNYILISPSNILKKRSNKCGTCNILMIICITFILSSTNQIILPTTLSDPQYFMEVSGFPLSRENKLFTFMLIMNFTTDLWNAMLFMPLAELRDALTSIVIEEFKCLSKTLRETIPDIQDAKGKIIQRRINFNEKLDEIINQHTRLGLLMKGMNSVFEFCNGTIVLLFLIICCIISYEIANELVYQKGYVIQIAMGIMTALYCLYLIYIGLVVYSRAHQLVDHIYAMPLHDLSHEAIIKLSFFLHRLTSEQIGISIGGCFVINPASVLTLIGSIITYSIVAYQTRS